VIETKTTYNTLSRSPKGTAPATVVGSMRIKVGPGEAIEATLTRSVAAETPVGVKRGVLNRAVSGKIGAPGKGGGLPPAPHTHVSAARGPDWDGT
jgi:hypothetical protein